MTWNPLKTSVVFAFSVKIVIKALGLHFAFVLSIFGLSPTPYVTPYKVTCLLFQETVVMRETVGAS